MVKIRVRTQDFQIQAVRQLCVRESCLNSFGNYRIAHAGFNFCGNCLSLPKKQMKFIAQLIVSALAVIITSMILPGVHVDNVLTALIVAAVLAFLNAIVKPVLVILTIPITVITLGLFLLVINALLILLAAKIVDGFHVDGFWIALLFSLVLSLVSSVFNALSGKNESRNQE